MLRGFAVGHGYTDHLKGRSSHGGAYRTLGSLIRLRLIDASTMKLTPTGWASFDVNGLCPTGRHGIDRPGQRCDICTIAEVLRAKKAGMP